MPMTVPTGSSANATAARDRPKQSLESILLALLRCLLVCGCGCERRPPAPEASRAACAIVIPVSVRYRGKVDLPLDKVTRPFGCIGGQQFSPWAMAAWSAADSRSPLSFCLRTPQPQHAQNGYARRNQRLRPHRCALPRARSHLRAARRRAPIVACCNEAQGWSRVDM